ncbi:MAG TPA: type II secretion system protein [Pyrinomonadaceae bacterium]|nr:type II secretion system protein [Pyrinomonadaceae bacterium]
MSNFEGTNPERSGMVSRVNLRKAVGFSLPELLAVLAILAIILTVSIPYLLSYRKLYRSDDQALKLMDMMQEASQYALTRRRTFRFEIDLTDNEAKIIDEAGTNPDFVIKSVPLDKVADVRVDIIPSGVTRPNPPNYNNAVFAADTLGHMDGSTSVTNHSVWAMRFQRDGSAVNAAGLPVSATLFIWPPASAGSSTPRNTREIRAITVFAPSSAVRFWKYNGSTFTASVN